MNLYVNGQEIFLDRQMSAEDWLKGSGIDPKLVAVEHNGVILEKSAYGKMLQEGDRLEVVRFVGGG